MSQQLLFEDTIYLRKSAFDKVLVRAGIDRGSSLTKIAFVPKETPEDADRVLMRCLTFHNDHFVDALHVMKEQAQLPDQGKLHITGVGAASHRDKIKEIFGLDIAFVDEIMTLGFGPFILIKNSNPEDIFYPIPDYKKWEGINFTSKFSEAPEETASDADDPFPALVFYMGSGCAVMAVDKEGRSTLEGTTGISGKPFMGMAHALLGTADYNEIMALAEKGDVTIADSTMGDLVKGDTDSPYGSLPSDMPGFPFGRAAEKSWDRSRCSREDLAASFVGLTIFGIVFLLHPVVQNTGITKIYFAGNFFRSEFSRKLLYEKIGIYLQFVDAQQVKIVKSGHQGAIGAMLSDPDPEEQKKMLK